jgi:Protein of unknown function (DUF3048) N-terminal domain/Protein of unknown function (DUF3048) C-terminal domain
MQRPDWLRLSWPPSTPVAAIAAGLVIIAVGGGAMIGMYGEQAAASPTATASLTSSVWPSSTLRVTSPPPPEATPSPSPRIACPLNGLAVDDPGLLDLPALAVQIENHPAARPARNLANADMVVEATVEGDVTRYTGIYLCRRTDGLTGPVRSARYYSIDLWQDLHVLPYFFGAGAEAVGRYRAAGMPFVNGITGAWPWFQRYGSAAAPHNLYTDLERARAAFDTDARLQQLASRVDPLRPPFAFGMQAMPTGRPLRHVEIWTNGYWHFGWEWNAVARRWDRSEAGAPHVDVATGEVLSARSVVVQLVREDVFGGSHDPAGNPRRFHHLVGSGRGILFVDGRGMELAWSRPTAIDGTTWTFADSGERVMLPPGVVWWEIMPLSTRVIETAG